MKIGKWFFINETIKRTWTRRGRFIWAVNGVDRSKGPTCSEAHEPLKREKIDAWGWQFPVCPAQTRPFEPIDPNICMWGDVHDVITRAIFFENQPKGFGDGRPRNFAFPVDFAHTTVRACDFAAVLHHFRESYIIVIFPEIDILFRFRRPYYHFRFSVVFAIVCGHCIQGHRACPVRQPQIHFRSSTAISISGLAVKLLFPVVRQRGIS